jgi:hypothetical protein
MDNVARNPFTNQYAQLVVRPINRHERLQWDRLMTEHHYLGFKTLVGESLRYVAELNQEWVALLGWSAAAFKCKPRDQWIGWTQPIQWQRLHLIANNSRFLILPGYHIKNLASKILSLNLKRLSTDWENIHGHPVLIAETFVDTSRFQGSCYKAANFIGLGATRGFGKSARRYYQHGHPKTIFVFPLTKHARVRLQHPFPDDKLTGGQTMKMQFTQTQIADLIDVLLAMPDPRKKRGKRHMLISILAISICAVLCGARNYAAIADFAKSRTRKQLKKLRCRYDDHSNAYIPPSEPTIRRVLQSCNAEKVDQNLLGWLGSLCTDTAIAFDGKTLKGAGNGESKVHLLSAVTHQTAITLAQQQVDSKTNEIPTAKILLEPMNLEGKVITADAMHTQTDTARFIVEEKQGDYFFIVKDNQPTLKNDIAALNLEKTFPPSRPDHRKGARTPGNPKHMDKHGY